MNAAEVPFTLLSIKGSCRGSLRMSRVEKHRITLNPKP